jgi:hypothetical protein
MDLPWLLEERRKGKGREGEEAKDPCNQIQKKGESRWLRR